MTNFSADPCVALSLRASDEIIGWRGSSFVLQRDFIQRLAAWNAVMQNIAGDKVALYMRDSLEFAAALLAAWQNKKTVWITADILPETCQTLSFSVDAFLGEFPIEYSPSQTEEGDYDSPVLNALSPDFLALVVHTSGSTGIAKAIPKKISQLTSEISSLEQLFGDQLREVDIIATVSHQHIYGLFFKVLWPLAAGRPIHALSFDYPEQFLQALTQRDCILISSPAHLKRLPEHLNWTITHGYLRSVFSSGGPLSLEEAKSVAQLLGKSPIEIYGSSETGGIAWRQRQQDILDTWHALPNVEWRIAKEENLLEIRSPHLMNDQWLRLSDKVQIKQSSVETQFIDPSLCESSLIESTLIEPTLIEPTQGFVLLGRNDRIVKIEEKRISLDGIEKTLLNSELVSEARILFDPEESGRRQQLTAFVVLSEAGRKMHDSQGKVALNQLLRQHLSDVVEAVALPRRWRYLHQMPVNEQGKTTYADLFSLINKNLDVRPILPNSSLLQQEDSCVLLELIVPSQLLYFDGHFPVSPVLPGVVQVDWAIFFGRNYFPLPAHFKGMQQLKFKQIIQAEMPIKLELTYFTNKKSLSFRYFSDAGQYASGNILFT